jgi:acyl carrier protein
MGYEEIEFKLRAFIDNTILRGQGADLTASTPLIELGILHSFHLFSLINFIAQEFDIQLQLELLASEDFQNTATIARAIHSRLRTASVSA